MPWMVIEFKSQDKRNLRLIKKRTGDKGLHMRCQIVLLSLGKYWPRERVAESQDCSVSLVGKVLRRYLDEGLEGLADRRADNGQRKVDHRFLVVLHDVVDQSPEDFGYRRPTWTRELLVKVLKKKAGVAIDVTTMSRALRRIGARRGRPRPTVGCPWAKGRKTRRLNELQRLLDHLPKNHVAVFEDEVDIHLNPKIGLDWMNRGVQKTVLTPGKNEKRYLAGAANSRTGRVTWVLGHRKSAILFLLLLWKLHEEYPDAKIIHVILDNYSIHSSAEVQSSLETEVGRRFRLHFLPPYCPQHNPIERIWLDLHANVTRNHRCRSMTDLLRNVRDYLNRRNRQQRRQPLKVLAKPDPTKKTRQIRRHESCTVI